MQKVKGSKKHERLHILPEALFGPHVHWGPFESSVLRNVTCVRACSELLQKHFSLYIKKAESAQKHLTLHTPAKTFVVDVH